MNTIHLGAYRVPDGYFGEYCTIHLVYDNEKQITWGVHPQGFYREQLPICDTAHEAAWLVANHPTCKRRFRRI